MRVQIFSDIHSDLRRLAKVAAVEADVYICAGDLVNWSQGLDACGEVLKGLGDKLWVLPGNHETETDISDFCAKFGFNKFHGNSFERDGWQFAGLGYSNPTPFDTPGEYSEEELAERLTKFSGLSPMILICHAPPKGTALDQSGPGNHFGSLAVRNFVDSAQPAHFFCGHIHEAAGVSERIGRTEAMNVGPKGCLLEIAAA
jgi:Icc-related predicted phosphoesterase